MAEDEVIVENRPSNALLGALAILALMALGALIWCYGLSNHLSAAETRLAAAEQKNAALTQEQDALTARLRASALRRSSWSRRRRA